MEEGRAERRRRTEAPSHPQGGTRRAGVMTDVHRRFLQLLMTHGVLEEWDVRRLQKHCYRVHDPPSLSAHSRKEEATRLALTQEGWAFTCSWPCRHGLRWME